MLTEEKSNGYTKTQTRFFIPIHGTHYKLRQHAELAMQMGMPADHIVVPDNGTIIEIREEGTKLVKLAEKAPDNVVMVDGFTIGDIQDVVIRDQTSSLTRRYFRGYCPYQRRFGKLKNLLTLFREVQYIFESHRIYSEKHDTW